MNQPNSILIVAIDLIYLDFNSPDFAMIPGINAEKILMGINGSKDELIQLGYDAEICWIDTGNTAIEVLQNHLVKKRFELVLIGAGIRKLDSNFLMFEKMINTIIQHSPNSKICFNTNPMDTTAAVKRWM